MQECVCERVLDGLGGAQNVESRDLSLKSSSTPSGCVISELVSPHFIFSLSLPWGAGASHWALLSSIDGAHGAGSC